MPVTRGELAGGVRLLQMGGRAFADRGGMGVCGARGKPGGTVWEAGRDWYAPYPADGAATPPASGTTKVIRVGSFFDNAWVLRVSYRYNYEPTDRSGNGGFRCVRGFSFGEFISL
jgi:hypothetical protein